MSAHSAIWSGMFDAMSFVLIAGTLCDLVLGCYVSSYA